MKRGAYICGLVFVLTGLVVSADTVWTGAGDGCTWASTANWSSGLPSSSNAAIFNNSSSIVISSGASATAAGTVTFNGSGAVMIDAGAANALKVASLSLGSSANVSLKGVEVTTATMSTNAQLTDDLSYGASSIYGISGADATSVFVKRGTGVLSLSNRGKSSANAAASNLTLDVREGAVCLAKAGSADARVLSVAFKLANGTSVTDNPNTWLVLGGAISVDVASGAADFLTDHNSALVWGTSTPSFTKTGAGRLDFRGCLGSNRADGYVWSGAVTVSAGELVFHATPISVSYGNGTHIKNTLTVAVGAKLTVASPVFKLTGNLVGNGTVDIREGAVLNTLGSSKKLTLTELNGPGAVSNALGTVSFADGAHVAMPVTIMSKILEYKGDVVLSGNIAKDDIFATVTQEPAVTEKECTVNGTSATLCWSAGVVTVDVAQILQPEIVNNAWFDVDGTPAKLSADGTWSGTEVSTSAGIVSIDAEASQPSVFTPSTQCAGDITTIRSRMSFAVEDDIANLGAETNTLAGVTLVATQNGKCFALYNGATKEWHAVAAQGITPDVDVMYDFKIVIDHAAGLLFYALVSGTEETSLAAYDIGSQTADPADVAFVGTGDVGALIGTYTTMRIAATVDGDLVTLEAGDFADPTQINSSMQIVFPSEATLTATPDGCRVTCDGRSVLLPKYYQASLDEGTGLVLTLDHDVVCPEDFTLVEADDANSPFALAPNTVWNRLYYGLWHGATPHDARVGTMRTIPVSGAELKTSGCKLAAPCEGNTWFYTLYVTDEPPVR